MNRMPVVSIYIFTQGTLQTRLTTFACYKRSNQRQRKLQRSKPTSVAESGIELGAPKQLPRACFNHHTAPRRQGATTGRALLQREQLAAVPSAPLELAACMCTNTFPSHPLRAVWRWDFLFCFNVSPENKCLRHYLPIPRVQRMCMTSWARLPH